MQHINNEPEQIKIRRAQNNLIVVGSGTILFSLWSLFRMVASLFLLKKETLASLKELPAFKEELVPDSILFAVLVVVVIAELGVIILIRVFVGRAAIAEGRGRKRSILYLVLAAIMILGNLFAIKNTLVPSPGDAALGGAFAKRNSASSIIIELTSAVMLFEMIVSACTIRKFRNKKSKGTSRAESPGNKTAGKALSKGGIDTDQI